MENLISLIVDLLSALFGGSKDEKQIPSRPVTRPDPSRPGTQARPTAWEDELRRLLEGQTPVSPPAALPPPVQRPAPMQAPQTPRVVLVPTVPARPAPVYSPRVEPMIPRPQLPAGVELANRQLASLGQSKEAYARASQLDKTSAARIELAGTQAVQLTTVTRRQVSQEISQMVSLFKNPRAARQAVIASVIFGSPRAFEEHDLASF